jgi:uncharacterized protein YndB with AHSA1/START domain
MSPKPIRWRLHIPVSPEAVYDALASDEGRAAFWAESARERDGAIAFRFINGVEYTGRVLEARRPERWSLEYFGGPATFILESDGRGGTDVTLVHEGIGVGDWVEVHAGWLNVLFPLKAWLAYRIDLRNHDPRRTWDDGYADQ